LFGKHFAHHLAHHAQQKAPCAFAHKHVVEPGPKTGFIIEFVGLYSTMKPKQCVNLAVILHPFGFVNGQRLGELV
jgi:hypothetical protein